MFRFGPIFSRRIHSVDQKWLEKWPQSKPHLKKNGSVYYQLPMFPYPSGKLHIGHLRVYTISDALARFRRMSGFNVVHPIGWDAFGLPAENAAIEHNVSASDWTYNHIDQMRSQLKRMMISFDWDREVITCSPEYYKHTQRIFLELHNMGLAYRKQAYVNWDPVDKTVLANEQIDSEGKSWRSGAIAERKLLKQWFLKITDFSDDLEKDLDLPELTWPEEVKKMQKQWIGTSYGALVNFGSQLEVFTTKPETIYGVKFIAVAPEHPLAVNNTENTRESGLIEGAEAIHPFTGEPLPVYVAEYVVSGYGTGAVMGVPAHDQRDQVFWNKISKNGGSGEAPSIVYDENGFMVGGLYNGMKALDARQRILDELVAANKGKPVKRTRIRDWLVSRQRFWGAPIPMVHCDSCGVQPVPVSELPVELPKDTKNVPLSENSEWLKTTCPKCKGPAHRDPDTMDTFMDSSWYFFRYLDPHNAIEPFNKDKVQPALPVNCYIGGIEHAILHLLYARFLSKALMKAGWWNSNSGEPFTKLITQGMVHGKTFRDKESGRYLKPNEISELKSFENVNISMEKMSKSKYNGVDPLDVIDKHGADATRAHMLFQAPVPDTLEWDSAKIVGVERWLAKVQSLVNKSREEGEVPPPVWNEACSLNASITESLQTGTSMNTIVSDYMKLTKLATKHPKLLSLLLKMMAPVCPAHSEEFWEQCGFAGSVHDQDWPLIEPLAITQECDFRLIINSKPQPPLTASPEATEAELLAMEPLRNLKIKRVIFKPQIKLLSITT